MSTVPAIHAALFGLRESLDRFNGTAERIARSAPGGDLAGDLVELTLSRRAFEANLVTLRTGDEMVGSLLDLLA